MCKIIVYSFNAAKLMFAIKSLVSCHFTKEFDGAQLELPESNCLVLNANIVSKRSAHLKIVDQGCKLESYPSADDRV